MILGSIKSDIQTSLKSGDSFRVSTLRMILSAAGYAAIKKYGANGDEQMTDEDVLEVIKKQAKERKESVDAFTKANRMDLAEKEKKELELLQTFLPKELTQEELEQIVASAIADGEKQFGIVMKRVISQVQGRADGAVIAATVKKLLV
jgi:uncharacterized protein